MLPSAPLSLRRKDGIVDLPKHLFAVSGVGFGGPLTSPGHCIALDSTGNRRFGPLGVELASVRGWGGNPGVGPGVATEDAPTPRVGDFSVDFSLPEHPCAEYSAPSLPITTCRGVGTAMCIYRWPVCVLRPY